MQSKEDTDHYIKKYKEHEARRASTNERQEFWQQWTKLKESKNSQE